MIANSPAIAGTLLGVWPCWLRQLLLCGKLPLLHAGGRPRAGDPGIVPRAVAGSAGARQATRCDTPINEQRDPIRVGNVSDPVEKSARGLRAGFHPAPRTEDTPL